MISFEVISSLLVQANQARADGKPDKEPEREPEKDKSYLAGEAPTSVQTPINHRQANLQARGQAGRIKTPKRSLVSPKIQSKAFPQGFRAAFNSFLELASHRPRLDSLFKTILNKLNIKDIAHLRKLTIILHKKSKRSAQRFLIKNSFKYLIHGLYLAMSLRVPEYTVDAFRIVRAEQSLNNHFGSTTRYYQRHRL